MAGIARIGGQIRISLTIAAIPKNDAHNGKIVDHRLSHVKAILSRVDVLRLLYCRPIYGSSVVSHGEPTSFRHVRYHLLTTMTSVMFPRFPLGRFPPV